MSSVVPPGWEETYLDTLAESGQKDKAAQRAGIGIRHIVALRHRDPAFERLENEAIEASFDVIESEAIRRAVEGVQEIRQGRNGEIITRIRYSDTLLLKFLQHRVWTHCGAMTPSLSRGPHRAVTPQSPSSQTPTRSNGSNGPKTPNSAQTSNGPSPSQALSPLTGTRGTCHTPVGPDGLIPFTPSERFPTIEAYRAAHAKVKADIAIHHQNCLRWSPPLPASQPFLPYQPPSPKDAPEPVADPEPVERVEGRPQTHLTNTHASNKSD